MIERIRRLPVLVLITFRPEFQPPWTGHAHVTTLTISRLGRRQGADLVARVTGDKPLPAEIVEQIVARDRRRAAVRRGADQDGARIGPARGCRRSLRAVRPPAAARDPDDAARLADGPARPPGAGQGGGADRRGDRPRVLPRAARGGLAPGRADTRATPWTSWSTPSWSSAAARRPKRPTLQARAGPGRGLPVAA